MSFNNSMTSSYVRRSGSCRKLSSIPPRVQSRCVRSFRVSCFNWCCNAFSSLMAFRSFFSLFSNSQLSFSSFEVSGKGSPGTFPDFPQHMVVKGVIVNPVLGAVVLSKGIVGLAGVNLLGIFCVCVAYRQRLPKSHHLSYQHLQLL